MKKIKRINIQIFTSLLFIAFISGCGNEREGENTEHGEMMEDEHTEMMDEEDHHQMEENSDMPMDSTSIERYDEK